MRVVADVFVPRRRSDARDVLEETAGRTAVGPLSQRNPVNHDCSDDGSDDDGDDDDDDDDDDGNNDDDDVFYGVSVHE